MKSSNPYRASREAPGQKPTQRGQTAVSGGIWRWRMSAAGIMPLSDFAYRRFAGGPDCSEGDKRPMDRGANLSWRRWRSVSCSAGSLTPIPREGEAASRSQSHAFAETPALRPSISGDVFCLKGRRGRVFRPGMAWLREKERSADSPTGAGCCPGAVWF